MRDLRPVALDRLCCRILDEIQAVSADASRSSHERYLAIYELIQDRDADIADAFNNPARSKAVLTLSWLKRLDLLTPEEFERFSAPTRDVVRDIAGAKGRSRRR